MALKRHYPNKRHICNYNCHYFIKRIPYMVMCFLCWNIEFYFPLGSLICLLSSSYYESWCDEFIFLCVPKFSQTIIMSWSSKWKKQLTAVFMLILHWFAKSSMKFWRSLMMRWINFVSDLSWDNKTTDISRKYGSPKRSRYESSMVELPKIFK